MILKPKNAIECEQYLENPEHDEDVIDCSECEDKHICLGEH